MEGDIFTYEKVTYFTDKDDTKLYKEIILKNTRTNELIVLSKEEIDKRNKEIIYNKLDRDNYIRNTKFQPSYW